MWLEKFAGTKKVFAASVIFVYLFAISDVQIFATAYARDRCGDGVCSALEKEAGKCKEDCNRFRGWCGNSNCELNENCRTCPIDCGKCEEGLEGIAAVACGDDVCSPGEGCKNCPEDCGVCPGNWAGRIRYAFRKALRLAQWYLKKGLDLVNLDGAVRFVEENQQKMRTNALVRTEAAGELLDFLAKHEEYEERLGASGINLVTSVAEQGEAAGALNIISSTRIRRKINKTIENEENNLREAFNQMLVSPQIQDVISEGTDLGEVKKTVEEGNISELAEVLPKSRRTVRKLKEELQKYRQIHPPSEETLLNQSGIAFAQGSEEEKELSNKDAFIESVQLLKEMRDIAKDPDAAAPTIEESIAYLQSRKSLVGGVIGITDEEVDEDLSEIEKDVEKETSSSLLNALNIARFIRTSDNFKEAEELYANAGDKVSYGFMRFFTIKSSLAKAKTRISKNLIPEQIEGLTGVDLEKKREALRSILRNLSKGTANTISRLPASEREVFEERFASLVFSLETAENVRDLQNVVSNWHVAFTDLQTSYNKKRNFFFRYSFTLRCLFGT